MDKGIRYNEGKPKWHLVDFDSLVPLVRVLEKGAIEYGEFNWKKGLDKTEIAESLIRHAMKLANGIEIDEQSGLPHYAHIMANAMFYSYFDNKEELEFDKFNQLSSHLRGFLIGEGSNSLQITNSVEGNVNEG